MNAPLRKVETREYRERLSCGHTISWSRPGKGTSGDDWPKLREHRRCTICAGFAEDEFVVMPDGWWVGGTGCSLCTPFPESPTDGQEHLPPCGHKWKFRRRDV